VHPPAATTEQILGIAFFPGTPAEAIDFVVNVRG
jgi:hypothetical protein